MLHEREFLTKESRELLVYLINLSLLHGDIHVLLPPTRKIHVSYVKMQHNFVNIRLIYVNMHHNYVDIKLDLGFTSKLISPLLTKPFKRSFWVEI